MEMKCYQFKDKRVLFKYLYINLVLATLNMILLVLQRSSNWQFAVNSSIIYLIIIFVVFKKTNVNIYSDEHMIKSKKMIQFKMINDISPTTGIFIKADNTNDIIDVVDIENNRSQYKELLDDMLSKVSKRLSDTKNSDEILETVKQNR